MYVSFPKYMNLVGYFRLAEVLKGMAGVDFTQALKY